MKKWHKFFRIIIVFLIILYLFLILVVLFLSISKDKPHKDSSIPDKNDALIDTLISRMSIEEKIGQLFIFTVNNSTSNDKEKIDSMIQNLKLGGIVFKQTPLLDRLIISNYVKAKSLLPIFIGSKGEAINNANCYLPMGKIINALNDSNFAYDYFSKYVEILKTQGVNIDFSNSLNKTSINSFNEGFSDNEEIVFNQSSHFHNLLNNSNIISSVNYTDSLFLHSDSLALDTLCRAKSKEISLSGFLSMQMSKTAIKSIISQTALYNFAKFYKHYYNFEGVIVAQLEQSENLEDLRLIFEAGADLFISDTCLEKHIKNFKLLVESNIVAEKEIDKRLKKIFLVKKMTVTKRRQLKSAEVNFSKIFNTENILLSWKLHEKSLSLIKNNKKILPFSNLLNDKTHLIMCGENKFEQFCNVLGYYINYSTQKIYRTEKIANKKLRNVKNVIVLIDEKYKVKPSLIKHLKKINRKKNLIIISFGSNVDKLCFADAVLFAYNNHHFSQINAAQVIAGTSFPRGNMVPNLNKSYLRKCSYSAINRLKYTIPEVAGFDHYKLKRIDSLVENAIEKGATPGAQILAAKNGKVFLYKSYGYHAYDSLRKAKNSDIYDIASITKVAATTLAAMKLYEAGKINLNDSIKYYVEDTINCTINNHQLADFFIHKTGIQPNMPILKYISYTDSVTGRYDKYFSKKRDSLHTIKLSDNYYFRYDYLDSIIASLYNLEIDTSKGYQYSDVNFNIIYDILKGKINGLYTDYLNYNIYNPLQLRYTGFLPLRRFDKSKIAPTQYDRYWRKKLLQGTPHDESAAIYGGVAGNAGLFSNANDLAIIFQMLLNGGTYGNAKIFNKSTIEYFITPPKNSKRALGFSLKSGAFGHTGFTGCVVWANPSSGFLFVFLSNSIHPRATNRKLRKMEIRNKAYNLVLQSSIK